MRQHTSLMGTIRAQLMMIREPQILIYCMQRDIVVQSSYIAHTENRSPVRSARYTVDVTTVMTVRIWSWLSNRKSGRAIIYFSHRLRPFFDFSYCITTEFPWSTSVIRIDRLRCSEYDLVQQINRNKKQQQGTRNKEQGTRNKQQATSSKQQL